MQPWRRVRLWFPHRVWPGYDFEIDVEEISKRVHYSKAVGSPGFNQTLRRPRNLGMFFQTTPEGFKLKENVFSAGFLVGVFMHTFMQYGWYRLLVTIELFICVSF